MPPSEVPPYPLPQRLSRADGLLAALLLLAAFLLASFPARNSDLWMHLATGRSLVQGGHSFGTDPFAYTTGASYWVNHAWFYDVLSYTLYQAFGGWVLVALKALLAAALAGIMLALCWRGPARKAAILIVALAVLVLSPYLELRPAYISYVLFGLTLWLLDRAGRVPPGRALRQYAPLLVLFALWVNLDDWFLLGPLTAALYSVGALLAARAAGKTAEAGTTAAPRILAVVAAAGLAVCLLNPHFWRTFTLPGDFNTSARIKVDEDANDLSGLSPLEAAYFRSAVGKSLAGWAYFPLVLVGLVSFAFTPPSRAWPRALVWGTLLLLSVYRTAAIPFFAIATGPFAALNFQAHARRAAPPAERAWYTGLGQVLVVVEVLALTVAAWPGWLLPGRAEPRRWAVETDPSLKAVALQLADWHADGKFAGSRGFNFSPAVANYCAWFCPAEKSFCDARQHLFPEAVRKDYLTVRRALLTTPPDRVEQSAQAAWRSILREAKVSHLVLHDAALLRDSSYRKLATVLRHLVGPSREWPVRYLRGGVLVFAKPNRADQLHSLPRLDLDRLAFHPPSEERAPEEGPARDPAPRAWWEAFWKPLPAPDLDRQEAFVHLATFQARQPLFVRQRSALWENSQVAGMVASQLGRGGSLPDFPGAQLRFLLFRVSRHPSATGTAEYYPALVQWAYQWLDRFYQHGDDKPAGALLSAIRAARRAVHDNPDDAEAHLRLGDAYRQLLYGTGERVAAARFADFSRLRQVQALTALKQAVLLKPELAAAHEGLYRMYQGMGALDLSLEHLEGLVRATRTAGPRSGETGESYTRRVAALEAEAARLGKQVRTAMNRFETRAFGRGAMGKASAADSVGLPGKALEILLQSNYTEFGREGAALELQLLLTTGQVKLVREWMDPKQEPILQKDNYHWLQTLLTAATGDYLQADGHIGMLIRPSVDVSDFRLRNVPIRTAAALLMAHCVLANTPAPLVRLGGNASLVVRQVGGMTIRLRRQADFAVLRGLLALEAGATADARRYFREGLALWPVDADGVSGLARHYLALIDATEPR